MVPAEWFDALRVYQLATLIEAVPRISLSRCSVKMHQRPTLWPTQRMSHQNVTPWQFHWPGHEPPPVPTYIYTGCYTDWVRTVVTTISCRLGQSNGSLKCPFAGEVTVGVHSEGVDIPIPLRWMTKMTRMIRNLKSRPWEWLAEVYGNLVIAVILVIEGVDRAVIRKAAITLDGLFKWPRR